MLVDRVVPGGVLYEDETVTVTVTVLMLMEGNVGQGRSNTDRVGEPRDWRFSTGTTKVVEAVLVDPSPVLVYLVVSCDVLVTGVVYGSVTVTVTVLTGWVGHPAHGHSGTVRLAELRVCLASSVTEREGGQLVVLVDFFEDVELDLLDVEVFLVELDVFDVVVVFTVFTLELGGVGVTIAVLEGLPNV